MGNRGPKPKGLTPEVERQIVELSGRGLSAADIAAQTGANERTVSRRVAALRGSLKPRQGSPAVSAPAPSARASEVNVEAEGEDGDDEGPGRSLTEEELEQAALGGTGELDELIRSIASEYKAAASGPLKQRCAGDYLKALDLRRKMTPPEVPDPNDNPDYIKLAASVKDRLHKMVDLVCEESRQG